MTPAVEELINSLNKNGGSMPLQAAMRLKIGTVGSRLDFQKRLWALERNGFITLSGKVITIHPDYVVKPEATLAEQLANYLMAAFENSKRLTVEAITNRLKELSHEFKMAGARRKKMLEDAIKDLQRRGIQLMEELEEGSKYFRIVTA